MDSGQKQSLNGSNIYPDETFKTDFERSATLSSYFYDSSVNLFDFAVVYFFHKSIYFCSLTESRIEASIICKFYCTAGNSVS